MKKRRTLIISLLLVAALALGVGYAAVTGNLFIHGKVTTAKQSFNVVFTAYETAEVHKDAKNVREIGGSTDALGEGVQTLKFFVTGMSYKDESLTGRFTVRNDNDMTMYFTSAPVITYATENSPFTVTYEWEENVANSGIAPGGFAHVKITVTMTEGITADDTVDYDFTVQLPATSTAPTPPAET